MSIIHNACYFTVGLKARTWHTFVIKDIPTPRKLLPCIKKIQNADVNIKVAERG